ncbi:MAG: hypothetical protein M1459_01810 [Patescibacteria group bacterium]|nr:hypothetical protein [Patescibacteria group bacterium]
MKKTLTKFTSSVGIITGLTLGAFALSALANYTSPTFAPPDCPADEPACNAPINVGSMIQFKNGFLGINELAPALTDTSGNPVAALEVNGKTHITGSAGVDGDLIVGGMATTTGLAISGNSPAAGKILTAIDATGKATWTSPSSISTSVVDINSWPRKMYTTSSATRGKYPKTMLKVTSVGGSEYGDDEAYCPPGAIMVGEDRNGSGNIGITCAAPKISDLPDSFKINISSDGSGGLIYIYN